MDGRNLRVCLVAAAGLGWVVSARGTAASSPPPPRPVKRYQKSADGARAVCRRWCRLPAEFQTTGNIWTHSWCAPSPAHTSPAQSINTLPIWTVSFSNHISQTWPSPQQMRRSANNSWAQRNDEMKTIVCTLRGDEEDEDGPWSDDITGTTTWQYKHKFIHICNPAALYLHKPYSEMSN